MKSLGSDVECVLIWFSLLFENDVSCGLFHSCQQTVFFCEGIPRALYSRAIRLQKAFWGTE